MSATYYDVRRSPAGQDDWTIIATGLSATEYLALNLQPETAYDWQVRAFAGGVYSDWTSTATESTLPVPPDSWVVRGSFAKRSGTGTQAVTGVGKQPKALILISNGLDSARVDSSSISHHRAWGVATGSGNQYSVASSDLNSSNVNCSSINASVIHFTRPTNGDVRSAASLVSFDADGFTLDWTVNNTGSGDADSASIIEYIAFGGDDLEANVVTWALPSITSSHGVTGMGFEPDLILNLHGGNENTAFPSDNGDLSAIGIGMADGDGNQFAIYNNSNGSTSSGSFRNNRIAVATNSNGLARVDVAHVSMDSDGFTVNVIDDDYAGMQMITLGLRGLNAAVGSFQRSTSTTNVIDGLGFAPDLLLNVSALTTVLTNVTTVMGYSVGISDAESQTVQTYKYTQNDPWRYYGTDAVHTGEESNAVTDATERASLDADGFTLDYVSGSNAHYIGYIAFAGSGISTTLAARGGVEIGGRVEFRVVKRLQARGGIEIGGRVALTKHAGTRLAVRGGIEIGGRVAFHVTRKLRVRGGIEVGGRATITNKSRKLLAVRGGLEIGGRAAFKVTKHLSARGGVVVGGRVAFKITRRLRIRGGIIIGSRIRYMGPGTGIVVNGGRLTTAEVLAMAEEGDSFNALQPWGGINGRAGTYTILERRITDERARPEFAFAFDPLSDPDDVPIQRGGGRVRYRPPVRSDLARSVKRERGRR